MSGRYYEADAPLLQPWMPCIIDVDQSNQPTGMWWGEVTATGEAKITGGAVLFTNPLHGGDEPLRSDEHAGKIPYLNYRLYPDTETTRHLLWKRHYVQGLLRDAQAEARQWRNAHESAIKATVDAAYQKGVQVGGDRAK